MNLDDVKKLAIPKTSGSYQYFNQQNKIIYVGKALNLRSRIYSYWRDSADLSIAKQQMLNEISKIEWIEVETEIEALLLEANLIKKYQPYYNVMSRDDKRFLYIRVNLADEIPTFTTVRIIGQSGKYYGPFISSLSVREVLKTLRRIWPYCTAKKISDTPCFYYHIGRCVGVCGKIISREVYIKNIIKPIMAFMDGKKENIIKREEIRIKKLKREFKKTDDEKIKLELERAEYELKHMQQVLANARVLSVGEKYQNDVVEVRKVLGLPKIPQRIEGYDISNLFGQEAVGSMVVFAGGEPDKNEYRKFKIKLENILAVKRGDTQMLTEMLTRRLQHDEWPLPDLIIIDGGKGQLNAITAVLKKYNLNLAVIGISKGEGLRSSIAPDKIFYPGQKLPLELPLASPALHLVKRVRDEAHRFAITYHRDLRSKKFLDKN